MKRLIPRGFCDLSVLIMGAALFTATGAFAQTQTAQVSGLITDPTGAVVPKASVTLVNKDDGVVRSSESNNEGYYVVPLLQPGNYTITVKARGFQTVTRDGIRLEMMQNARIDFSLQVGATQQTVEVTANASPLNFENAELKGTIDPKTLEELPLIVGGSLRSAASFVILMPGVSTGVASRLIPALMGASSWVMRRWWTA